MTLTHRWFLLFSLLCAMLAPLPFLPGLPGDFLLDDHAHIVDNTNIRLQSLRPAAVIDAALSTQAGTTRVLPTVMFALDYYRGDGLDPATFKATNLAIHAATTFALAWFLRALLLLGGMSASRAPWWALTMALFWALHPLQASSVLYIVQRMQTMATLFVVLALWSYVKARHAQFEGRSGRTALMLSGLAWVMALGCKEDAILLPLYMLALELTVLRFRAADPRLARNLQRGYLIFAVAGALVFLLVVVPSQWSWDAYPGRNFSSAERLLTQGRVLCLYLWQILLPLPSHMPFYYDWIQPSRSMLEPPTTLPALLAVIALLAMAWRFRHQRPLFALGLLLFFAGHFMTSNANGLELAFEHRNHFPLIGIALAAGDLLALCVDRFKARAATCAIVFLLLVAALSLATITRARSWESRLVLALTSTQLAPNSGRAWQTLCVTYFELGGGPRPDNPNLGKARAACEKGAEVAGDSITSPTHLIAIKANQGTLTQADWDAYLDRLGRITMTPENASRVWVLIDQVRKGVKMDDGQVLAVIDMFHRRAPFRAIESAVIGYFILGHTRQPERAYRYFARAIRTTTDPSFAAGLIEDLRKEGHPAWADRLQAAGAD